MGALPTIHNPSKENPDETVAQTIINHLRLGDNHTVAARCAGTTLETLTRWIARGHKEIARLTAENQDNPRETEVAYVNLALEADHAEGMYEAEENERWRQAQSKDWRAIPAYREDQHPERYADRGGVLTATRGGLAVARVLSLDEAEALVAQIEAAKAEALAEGHVARAIEVSSSEVSVDNPVDDWGVSPAGDPPASPKALKALESVTEREVPGE